MTKRMDWEKAQFDSRFAGAAFEPADPDMNHEPEHQEWWGEKSAREKREARERVERELAEAFKRGRPEAQQRPKEVISALISPKVKALLAEANAAQRRREKREQKIAKGGARPKGSKKRSPKA